uniref:NADH:ubiquinone reductase (H(+)-translocating) n=1 Tax=Neoseiulus womersleyi TaxID=322050 RepID=A0A8F6YE22_9ACAR|nr:NADH dehydrogenase subunit 5 [Neoseiulus womersleyi]
MNFSYLFFLMFLILLVVLYFLIIFEKIFIFEVVLNSFDYLVDFKLYFYMDFMSCFFLLVVSLIVSSAFFYSNFYMESDKNKAKFLILTFFFVVSMFLVILSLNSFLILIGWDGLGIVSYLLIIHYFSSMSNYSGMVTIMINRFGDIGMIFSLFFILASFSLDFIYLNEMKNLNWLVGVLIILGCMTKSAQFPFSVWLPLAMAAPTPISALVHSSTLVTAGVYLLVRMNFIFKSCNYLIIFLVCVFLMTMVMAGVLAMFEMDIKKIIAFSTLSQLGLMMLVIGVGYDFLGFFHILSHSMFKALLFFCSGVFIHEFLENQDSRNYTVIFKINIMVCGIFLVCSMALSGFPFLSGFYSKDLIFELLYSMNFGLYFLFLSVMSIILSVFYSVRMIYFGCFLGKQGFSMIYSKFWDGIYYSLYLCFFGVLFFGSLFSWLMLEKLEVLFLVSELKLLNLFFVFFSVFLMIFILSMKFYSKGLLDFFLKFMYWLPCQGFYVNKFLLKMNYFYFSSENMLESIIVEKNYSFLLKLSFIFSVFKFFVFFLSLLFLIFIYIICM